MCVGGGRGAGRSRLFRAPLFLAPLMRLRRPPPPGFRRRQWARVTVPARPPGEARPGLGRRRWRPRTAGAGGAAAAGTAGRGASRGGGLGTAAARLQERAAAAAELVGGPPRGARDPRPPGMGAAAVRSGSQPAGARPRKAGCRGKRSLAGQVRGAGWGGEGVPGRGLGRMRSPHRQ